MVFGSFMIEDGDSGCGGVSFGLVGYYIFLSLFFLCDVCWIIFVGCLFWVKICVES